MLNLPKKKSSEQIYRVCHKPMNLWYMYYKWNNINIYPNGLKLGIHACLFVCLFALRPKSTAMVIAGRSVHLTTLFFLGKLEQAVNQ